MFVRSLENLLRIEPRRRLACSNPDRVLSVSCETRILLDLAREVMANDVIRCAKRRE